MWVWVFPLTHLTAYGTVWEKEGIFIPKGFNFPQSEFTEKRIEEKGCKTLILLISFY